jgi:vacuolar-type H+-ATPase subunit H
MSKADLDELERDVEQARARFADDLARLRSPRNLSAFKDDLWAEATQTKDELIEKTKEAAKDGAQRLFTDLKERAAANPAAALAIGAGLAWRIAHRPPIASLLVGIGLVSLLRTSPPQNSKPYMGLYDEDPPIRRYDENGNLVSRASGLVESAKDRVQEWTDEAGNAARDTVTRIKETATSAADRVSEAARETVTQIKDGAASAADRVSHTTREAATSISDTAASVADKASSLLHDAVPDQKTRDQYLLGVAALAVAAAVGIAIRRRSQETP